MRLALRQTHLYRFVNMEVTPRFELGNEGFADPCLTTWLCHRIEKGAKYAGALREFLRLLFSLILKYYNSCDLSTKIDKILNLFAG